MNLVFLLEEQSMKEALNVLVPKIVPEHWKTIYLPHQGKADLIKSIPKKLRSWNIPDTIFVILIDKDSNDCVKLKEEIVYLTLWASRPETLVRIVCTELESWFIGDLAAVAQAYSVRKAMNQNRGKYRDPDKLANAKNELRLIVPAYQPIIGARAIAPYMNIESNKSHSFNVFIRGLKNLVEKNRVCG